ncbi:MAG: methylenetetrahydrofolate reductase C-terminal domain-containing protein [Deltaproteobacteria bacterium]|nr:methylenetetrahydrofolate reductase C-terminal domain-containing protein [Deltaproteobacteria bacterium]
MKRTFREYVEDNTSFVRTMEFVSGRGSRGKSVDDFLALAQKAVEDDLIQALSITDNPGGHPALAPDVLGEALRDMGMDCLVHFTCKDKNRNQIESRLHALDRACLPNLLVMTGDYPSYGFMGPAKPVFDLDSVHVLSLVASLNRGHVVNGGAPGGDTALPTTEFFQGAVISPFKAFEAEIQAQYAKLRLKLAAGASFLVTQVGFDVRKFDELIRMVRMWNVDVPVIGNVYIPSLQVARAMHRGTVPGCVITDEFMAEMEKEAESSDGGREAKLRRVGQLMAVLKGLGYRGAHIGGPGLNYDDILRVEEEFNTWNDRWTELIPRFQFPQKDGYYLFKLDLESGLNSGGLNAKGNASPKHWTLLIYRALHRWIFDPTGPMHMSACRFFRWLEKSRLERPFTYLEYYLKEILFDCYRCGDCTLAHFAFLCPQSQCPKFLLNGACGGSHEGWCEVYPGERRCIYVRTYDRLRPFGEEDCLAGRVLPPRNWALNERCSWGNYFMGRDHVSRLDDYPRPACGEPSSDKGRDAR